jgi:hypothetical protein
VNPSARADVGNKKTTVNISQPIEVPGAILPAGKYVMKLVNLSAERHVVQFTNEREDHVFAATIAVPAYRQQITEHTALAFYEAPVGQPQALKDWFYPGEHDGQEFIYPEGHGVHLASVATTPSQNLTSTNVSPVLTPETEARTPIESAAPVTQTPAPAEPTEVAQAAPPRAAPETVAPPPASTLPADNSVPSSDSTLPKTASDVGAMAGLGVLSLTGAFVSRKVRKARVSK